MLFRSDGTRVRPNEPADDIEQRRLPGSVGPDDTNYLPLYRRHGDPVESEHSAEPDTERCDMKCLSLGTRHVTQPVALNTRDDEEFPGTKTIRGFETAPTPDVTSRKTLPTKRDPCTGNHRPIT